MKVNWKSAIQRSVRFKAVIITSILLLLALTGVVQRGVCLIGNRISQGNDKFLTKSISSTTRLMVPVALAKGAADVIEGSEAVVEWGDVTQPILDYLNVAWRILILSLIVSIATKYILLGTAPLANVFLLASLFLYLAQSLVSQIAASPAGLRIGMRRMATLFLLGYLLLVAILPLTISGTEFLSRTVVDPLRPDITAAFNKTGQVFSMESITQQDGFLDKVDAMKKKSAEIVRFCGTATVLIAASVAKLAVAELLQGIVFPLAWFAFLIWLVRGVLWPAMGLSDRSLVPNDLRGIKELLAKGLPSKETTSQVEPVVDHGAGK